MTFHPQLNLIVGDNGAGKTTVLECLQVLSRGSSTRGGVSTLASHGEQQWSIQAGIAPSDVLAAEDKVRVSWHKRLVSIVINDELVSRVDLTRRIPVLSITPHSHRLMEEGPGLRRRYLDWGVFHVEHQFLPVWRRMIRVLSQRNAAIRHTRRAHDVAVWNNELIDTADKLTRQRTRYVQRLEPMVQQELQAMGDQGSWSLQLNSGWKAGKSYKDILVDSMSRDLKQGFTGDGPHRAELEIRQSDRYIKNEISRGQQKLLTAALILAQGRLHQAACQETPALLVDDFAAELSSSSRQRLLSRLEDYPGQKFLTALDFDVLKDISTDHAMFHVEHGRLSRLNYKVGI